MNQNKNNKKGGKLGIGVVFFVIMALSALTENWDNIRWQLWRMGLDTEALLPLVFAVVAILVACVFLKAKGTSARPRSKGFSMDAVDTAGNHSHDRNTVSKAAIRSCDGLEHWKDQLDGFIKAGLIDRAEYNVLLERYKKDLESNKRR